MERNITRDDILILGGGPAGLPAARYAARAGKRCAVLERAVPGGQIVNSPLVENYPGLPHLSGMDFAARLQEQAEQQGAELLYEEALHAEAQPDGSFLVTTDTGSRSARALILATGVAHRSLGLPGEEALIGSGVSYCALCDGAFYAGRDVAVVGGGNTALQDAVLLSETCRSVTILQNKPTLTGEHRLEAILRSRENVKIMCGCTVNEIVSTGGKLDGVKITDDSGRKSDIKVDGVFVAIGQVPENEPFARVVSLDGRGYIVSDESCTTLTPGIYAAGDCRTKEVRQVTTATADGAAAALAAIRYIDAI